jgi:uncharacterized protein
MSAFEDSYLRPPLATPPLARAPGQILALATGAGALILLAAAIWHLTGAWRLTALTAVGALIGFSLHRSDYGFAGSFRALIEVRDASALKSHALMLVTLSLIALPLLAMGEIFGQRLVGVVTPVGVAFVTGALIFGIGMQLGSGCASGTLYGLGGGDARLAVTLAGFITGSALGASHMGWWWTLPKLEAVTLLQSVDLKTALAIQLISLGLFWGFAHLIGQRCAYPETRRWSLAKGALALGLLNAAVLVVSGQPWGEAPAFALWGSKIVAAFGVDVLWWDYWSRPGFDRQIEQSVLFDSVSVLNISIVVGALLAAASAGQFRLRAPKGAGIWVAAILGGVMMGYGARLTNGCNIGAYVSGVGTGAISGWVWLAIALIGSYAGVKIRPLFGLARTTRTDGTGC